MTVSFTFQQEYSYQVPPDAIDIPVRVIGGPIPVTVTARLDTGAVISVFDAALAPSMGIGNYTSGTPKPLTAANGTGVTAFVHLVRLELWGQALDTPIAFVPGWPNLLGMQGFLERFRVAIDHGNRKYYV